MPACFEAGCDDGIDSGLLKGRTLLGRSRRANRDDAICPALIQNLFWWNSEDEAEYWDLRVQQHTSLIFKWDLRIRFVCRTRRLQGGEMDGKGRKAPIEGLFVRCSGAFVFHRDPQVHCERFRCEGANLSDHVLDRLRSQAVRTKRSERAKVGDRCRQFL